MGQLFPTVFFFILTPGLRDNNKTRPLTFHLPYPGVGIVGSPNTPSPHCLGLLGLFSCLQYLQDLIQAKEQEASKGIGVMGMGAGSWRGVVSR